MTPHVEATRVLSTWLSAQAARPVQVTWTRNRATMLSTTIQGGFTVVRLHVMFMAAGDADLLALARYIVDHDAVARRHIRAFIAAHHSPARVPQRPPPEAAIGCVHALQPIYDALNVEYFHGRCTAGIRFGRRAPLRPRRCMQLGCYVPGDNLIRIHPGLDRAFVPSYFVAHVVFHEMLHEIFGFGGPGRRQRLHPPEFMAVEQSHPEYVRCRAWQAQHLPRLLRSQ